MPGVVDTYLRSYRYEIIAPWFTLQSEIVEVSGASIELGVIEHTTPDGWVSKFAGKPRGSEITIRNARAESEEAFAALINAAYSNRYKAVFTVIYKDQAFIPRKMIDFFGAFITKVTAGDLNIENEELVIEEITVVYDYMKPHDFPDTYFSGGGYGPTGGGSW